MNAFKAALFLVMAFTCLPITEVFAQAYPSKPIRFVIPSTPGAATDIRGRWTAERLSRALGQPVVVDNRGGAGGIVGTDAGAKSAPDGYTLVLVHQGTLALAPHIYAKLPYDPIGDLAPVNLLSVSPLVLAIHPSMQIKTVAELVRLARERPEQLNYGSPGTGTPPHMAGELFKSMANITVTHIPYKGGGPALIDLVGGRLTYTFDGTVVQLPYVQAGKIRALATTGKERLASLPDVPTVAESGVPGYEFTGWVGVSVPARTPAEIIARLNNEIAKILATSEAREWLATQGAQPGSGTPAEFGAYIKAEHSRWGPIIRKAGIKAD
ncbi:MAG TPA: tripartite tricarboxylate transporter substrate binding protein [Burkholderiales bacterium]|nr:tripartite tricarboxylate transporter substrate binding protein [Burkholderiales bacterium]